MSAAMRVSLQDQKNIEKYTKALIFKFIQTVIQSRRNSKCHNLSKIFPTKNDWFGISIPEIPEITAVTKNAFSRQPVDLRQPVCIEILLKTSEDETILLEYWWLINMKKASLVDCGFMISSQVYNYIGTLLKSLCAITRVTPAYQLSRNQSPGSYHILHRIQFGEPELYLENDFKKHLVASAPSPCGDIGLFVAYKTKLLICPRKPVDIIHDIKDDHFDPDVKGIFSLCLNETRIQIPTTINNANQRDISTKQKKAAFCSQKTNIVTNESEDVPFASLLLHTETSPIISRRKRFMSSEDGPKQKDEGIEIVVMHHSGDSISNHSTSSYTSDIKDCNFKDDFVMVELRAPFAGPEEELGRFYRECQAAPSLNMFEENIDVQETINSLNDQLAQFESSALDFNDFINSLEVIES